MAASDDLSSPGERRPERRRRSLLAGIISFDNGRYSCDCTIRDLSEGGARLIVSKEVVVPSGFYVVNISAGAVYKAKTIWRKSTEIGVAFMRSWPVDRVPKPARDYLMKLWLAKGPRTKWAE